MNVPLSKSAQAIQDIMSQKGLHSKVVELPESARTAQEAASAIGCMLGQIAKSLIFKTEKTHKPILVLTSGPNRVNEKLIEAVVGEKIIKADAEFTREVTGFAIGGIPPLGHKQHIRTFIDQDLLTFDIVWAAAGTPHAVFSLKAGDLEAITQGTVMAIH